MPDPIPLPRPRLGQTEAAEKTAALTIPCPYEPCAAPAGQPCTWTDAAGVRHESTTAHSRRRSAARRAHREANDA